jgi:iron complex outermembrane receptor protein
MGSRFIYQPTPQFQASILNKYVGKQYMGNIDSEVSVLDPYTHTDLNISYDLEFDSWPERIAFSALINNVFDATYESNGYFFTFDDDFSNPGTITTVEGAGYYPQAGIHFLLGASIHF